MEIDDYTYWSHVFFIKKIQTYKQQREESIDRQEILYNNINYSIRNLSKKNSTIRAKNYHDDAATIVLLEKNCFYFFEKRQSSFLNNVASYTNDYFYKSKKPTDESMMRYSNSLFSLPINIFTSTKNDVVELWFLIIDMNIQAVVEKINFSRLSTQIAFNLYYDDFDGGCSVSGNVVYE
jgi:hypothetical protein